MIKRWLSGAAHGVLTFVCMCLAVAIPYATIGFVEYPVMAVISGLTQPTALDTNTTLCIEPGSSFNAPNTTAKYLVRMTNSHNGAPYVLLSRHLSQISPV